MGDRVRVQFLVPTFISVCDQPPRSTQQFLKGSLDTFVGNAMNSDKDRKQAGLTEVKNEFLTSEQPWHAD